MDTRKYSNIFRFLAHSRGLYGIQSTTTIGTTTGTSTGPKTENKSGSGQGLGQVSYMSSSLVDLSINLDDDDDEDVLG